MKRNLRKGFFHLELNHQYGTDTVGVEMARVELNEGLAIFKLKIKPVSDHQSSDANDCKDNDFRNVKSFSLHDGHIRKGMAMFINAHRSNIAVWQIEVEYGARYIFSCKIKAMGQGGVMFRVVPA